PLRGGLALLDCRRSVSLGPGALHRQSAFSAIEGVDVQTVSRRLRVRLGSHKCIFQAERSTHPDDHTRRRYQWLYHYYRAFSEREEPDRDARQYRERLSQ